MLERGGLAIISRRPTKEKTRRLFYFLGAFALIGWAYVLFMSDLFIVSDIQVSGVQRLDEMDVKREVFDVLDQRRGWKPWPARHSWFINVPDLQNELKARLFAQSVVVDNSYQHILRLKIEERANRLIYHSHQQYLWVDLQGLVTAELNADERKQVQARILGQRIPSPYDPPVIHCDLEELMTIGYRVAETNTVKSWIEKASSIMAAGISYREIDMESASSSLAAIVSPEGYNVLIDLDQDLDTQMKTYKAFKRAESNIKVSEYLDVRVPGRVYVK